MEVLSCQAYTRPYAIFRYKHIAHFFFYFNGIGFTWPKSLVKLQIANISLTAHLYKKFDSGFYAWSHLKNLHDITHHEL